MSTLIRRRVEVAGTVQGVGFRPFVYNLALRHDLSGFVFNNGTGVVLEIEGTPADVDAFLRVFVAEAPPLARILRVQMGELTPQGGRGFQIVQSAAGTHRTTLIAPDTAPCADCICELFDPADRRAGYPFINCTNCGPRFTIIYTIPYDRQHTTMHTFQMCKACQAEYEEPRNRRFHAQPNACAACGPTVQVLDRAGNPIVSDDAIAMVAQRLAAGAVLAIKGLGGYHLACNALDAAAVARLRQRKQREAKPFALMLPDVATARAFVHVAAAEESLLTSIQRPIVLLRQRPASEHPLRLPPALAPGYATLGIMLPYTPLHELLLVAYRQALPASVPPVLVMTSGNLSDEPIVYRDDDALDRLLPLVDAMLTHNRPIHMRCDDSIVRVVAGAVQPLRRARGYVPQPIEVGFQFAEPVLATGAHLKNTFCLGRGQQALVSHHIGDLENLETLASFTDGISHFARLFDMQPTVVAYDLHPDYLATRYALEQPFAQRIGVQHHHAHIASVLAEHRIEEPVIGVAADGTGYGLDGTIWGGEILLADRRDFTRLLHLRHLLLPGGEQAVRQPWRIAAAWLWQVYGDALLELDLPLVQQLAQLRWRTVQQMLKRGINTPRTSSMGRLFDAVGALVGLRHVVQYEGQAAIELEMCATPTSSGYPFDITPPDGAQPGVLETTPLLHALVADVQAGVATATVAGRFHATVAAMLLAGCRVVREQRGVQRVALSGGVFQNRLLLETLHASLHADGFTVYTNEQVPPNDGGLSLGQAAVAAARLAAG